LSTLQWLVFVTPQVHTALQISEQRHRLHVAIESSVDVTEARKAVPFAGILFISLRRFIIVTT
jgi:hypothetical protein